MIMQPDNELLQQYVRSHSEDAFAELVRRHVNLVYSAALRQVAGDAHLARDVAQNVFTDLARKAASLSRRESLTGWLYTSAYFAANKIVRTEFRRRQREEQFMREPIHHTPDTNWEQLRPALDSVMHELNETDREAVLLRYFENRAFAEVGAKLNLNENAARMRVDRALEKLRALLAKRGITTGTALAAIISANAVQTAPTTLATTLATASLTGASTGGLTFLQTINALKFKIGAGALAIAGAAVIFTTSRNTHAIQRVQNAPPPEQITESQAAGENTSPTFSPADNAPADNHSVQPIKPAAETGQIDAKNFAAPVELQTTNAAPGTNKVIVKLEIKFVTLSANSLQALRPAWPGGDHGILTLDQFKFVGEAVEHMGTFSTTQSRIMTFNGHEAIIGTKTPVLIGDTNASVDTMFGVTPYFSPESSIFRLDLFVGLGASSEDSSVPASQMIGKTNEITLSFGQIAVLQKEIPPALLPSNSAAGEPKELLVFVVPELGDSVQETQPETPADKAAKEAGRLKMMEARDGVLALITYASDNQNQLPPTLAQAASYFKDGGEEGVETNFDLIYSGSITNIAKPSETILLKEKQAWQAPNGAWLKVYGFADGHSEVHKEANGNFDQFEKKHTFSPEN